MDKTTLDIFYGRKKETKNKNVQPYISNESQII